MTGPITPSEEPDADAANREPANIRRARVLAHAHDAARDLGIDPTCIDTWARFLTPDMEAA